MCHEIVSEHCYLNVAHLVFVMNQICLTDTTITAGIVNKRMDEKSEERKVPISKTPMLPILPSIVCPPAIAAAIIRTIAARRKSFVSFVVTFSIPTIIPRIINIEVNAPLIS